MGQEELSTILRDIQMRTRAELGWSPKMLSGAFDVPLDYATNIYWQTQQDLNAQKIATDDVKVTWHRQD